MNPRLMTILAFGLAIVIFAVTLVSIRNSRDVSFELLQAQGRAITETLAQASENAIKSEMFYDRLVQARYSDLTASLFDREVIELSDQDLVSFALVHDLNGVHVFDSSGNLIVGAVARGAYSPLPDFVTTEVSELLAEPEQNYVLLLAPTERPGEAVHYYLEISPSLEEVIVLETDALFYSQAVQETGIGFLAQRMAREKGVEYIVYQSEEGIIFSSRRIDELLAIESDTFLTQALQSDSIVSRLYDFQGEEVLEMVRPFSSEKFPFGVFRVGISLEGFNTIKGEFRTQMWVFSGTLVILLMLALLYINARTRRKELSRQYRDIKSVTDTVFEQMETGVAVVGADGTIRLANGAFHRAFAVSDITGKAWQEALPRHADLLTEMSSGSSKRTSEKELSFEVEGEPRTLLLACSTLVMESEQAEALVLVVYDISRLKDFERQAARKERLSEMGNLAAGVAHEIRNPLNTISIAAQRLAGEFEVRENAEQFKSFTSQIRTETRRLNEIITRFLALAREERKRQQTVDLESLFRDLDTLLGVEAREVGMTVSLECEPGLRVLGDADQLRQVFLNLFNNAKEALDGTPGVFNVVARADKDRVIIAVADNGPGIPAEAAEKVFAPYYTTKEAGTGLGLPTVQRIVTEMGGEIELQREFTDGALFVVTLPSIGPGQGG